MVPTWRQSANAVVAVLDEALKENKLDIISYLRYLPDEYLPNKSKLLELLIQREEKTNENCPCIQ